VIDRTGTVSVVQLNAQLTSITFRLTDDIRNRRGESCDAVYYIAFNYALDRRLQRIAVTRSLLHFHQLEFSV